MKTTEKTPVHVQNVLLGSQLLLVVEYYDNGEGELYTEQILRPTDACAAMPHILLTGRAPVTVQSLRDTADNLLAANAIAEQKLKRKIQRRGGNKPGDATGGGGVVGEEQP